MRSHIAASDSIGRALVLAAFAALLLAQRREPLASLRILSEPFRALEALSFTALLPTAVPFSLEAARTARRRTSRWRCVPRHFGNALIVFAVAAEHLA